MDYGLGLTNTNVFFKIGIGILFFTSQSFSQYKLDYDKDSKWFWDFNYGATWHTTDMRTKLDNGFGFTVGKSFNFNYGKKISF